MKIHFIVVLFSVLLFGASCSNQSSVPDQEVNNQKQSNTSQEVETKDSKYHRIEFSEHNGLYRFSAEIPKKFMVENVASIKSINIYNPEVEADTLREKSQIFIRNFSANSFLTLSTVTIHEQEKITVLDRDAVTYDIEKKAGIANFPQQPLWRNLRHNLTDIRLSTQNPSLFYVFAYNPALGEKEFNHFIDSIIFHNDKESFVEPINRANERITKKPFGLEVAPDNSPVDPEVFSGFHTGVDFEIFENEPGEEVAVNAICGGELIQKRTVSGYGGVLAQSCELDGEPIRVIYGHVAMNSIEYSIGHYIVPGEQIAVLGEQGIETDNERKHLHLGIYKGTSIDISGYVQSKSSLDKWIDYNTIF